jgi:hypothetical protein
MSRTQKIIYNNSTSKVSKDNGLFETDTTYPPVTNGRQIIVYSKSLTLNNDGVTTDMKVDGSVNNQEFFVQSEENFDIFINSVSFFIAAELTTADLSEFGGTTQLTNGCQLIHETEDRGQIIIGDNLRTNLDFLRMCGFQPNFGLLTTDAFKVSQAFSNNDDGYFFILNFTDYGYDREYSGGIRLKAGKNERLVLKIRDNLNLTLTQLSTFDGRVYGFKRLK